jgi:molybdopterin guanine dinucleotide-containing S/N-oxide reductase-like protein
LTRIRTRTLNKGTKTVVKGLSGCGVTEDANTVAVDIKDGRIIRIRPLHYDWQYNRKPWKIKARGKVFEAANKSLIPPWTLGYKNRVNSPNRVFYPLKRVDWDPNGERNTQNRGISHYERISWDQATDIVASEIRRVIDRYGPTAVLVQGDGHGETKTIHAAHGCARRLMRLLGGYTFQVRNPDSWEGWYWGAKHVWGFEPVGKQSAQANIMPDIARNTDMILFWGCDPETTPWGWGGQTVSQLCYWFKELGIKQVYVCPDVNYGTAVHADKWIPILPGTDAALHLAIANVWITEDTYDKDYIASHAVGFDKFADYVLGKTDGVAKTPAWASPRTGVPSRIIKALARTWAKNVTSIAHSNGGNMARCPYAHENMRLEVCLLGMQGLGKPGRHMMSANEWGLFGVRVNPPEWGFGKEIPVPRHASYPNLISVNQGFSEPDIPPQFIPKPLIAKAILEPPISWYGTTSCAYLTEDQFIRYRYPADGCSEIHIIWTDTPSLMSCWNDSNYTAKAYQSPKVEFMLAQHPWIENDCQFADIILPVATKFELDDIGIDNFSAEFGTLYIDAKCVPAKGESRSDYEAVCAVAEKLGILEEYTGGKTVGELIREGFDISGINKWIGWEEFKRKGHFVIPNDPEWKDDPAQNDLMNFAKDPEKHPLGTPTGKLEYCSERLAKHFPDDSERPPVPGWIEKGESHDERLSSERAKKYPYLVLSSHPRWRVHSQHDDMQWLREMKTCKIIGPDGYGYQTMWVHPQDAARKGVGNGDIVKVLNERGGVLAGVYVTERIMPGVISIDHGARYDPIVAGELDRGGAINTITPRNTSSKNATGMVSGGFLADFERVDLDKLRNQYPEAFNRPYDAASGLRYERILA